MSKASVDKGSIPRGSLSLGNEDYKGYHNINFTGGAATAWTTSSGSYNLPDYTFTDASPSIANYYNAAEIV